MTHIFIGLLFAIAPVVFLAWMGFWIYMTLEKDFNVVLGLTLGIGVPFGIFMGVAYFIQ